MGFLPIMAGIAAAGALVQGVGGVVSGIQNKKRLKSQAKEELSASQGQERELRAEARRALGAQISAQWANGMTGDSGSAIAAIRESQLNAVLDARELRRQGTARASSLRSQGKQEMTQGLFAGASGLLGAAGSVMGAKNDWAQARSGSYG